MLIVELVRLKMQATELAKVRLVVTKLAKEAHEVHHLQEDQIH